MKSYSDCLKILCSVSCSQGHRPDLRAVLRLNQKLGDPANQFPSVHIAGTNGKGSVAVKVARSLEFGGYRVGLFTSPHLLTFRERIQINGQMIPEQDVVRLFSKVYEIATTERVPVTFFDLTTVMAFCYFSEQGVDVAVLEVGLGGRLDATNIVTPLVSVITNVGFDHTEFLGSTLKQIAKEKGGIIKPKVPVVLGVNCACFEQFEQWAKHKGSVLTVAEEGDDENMQTARRCLEVLKPKFPALSYQGLEMDLPCRFEKVGSLPVILDGAHNPDGWRYLFRRLQQRYPNVPVYVVFGIGKDKDVEGCLSILMRYGHCYYPVALPEERGVSVDLLAKMLKSKDVVCCSDVATAVLHAIADAKEKQALVLVAGSFYLMADARRALEVEQN